MFEKPGVKGGLPLGLPQVVPGFIVFDLFRRLEGRVFRPVMGELNQAPCPLHPYFVEGIGVINKDMGKGQGDPHLPGLFEQVGGVRDKVSGINHLGSGSLDLGQIGGEVGQKQLVVILADDLGPGILSKFSNRLLRRKTFVNKITRFVI